MIKEILEGKERDKSKEFKQFQKIIKTIKNSLDSYEEEFRIISTTPQGSNGEWLDEKEEMIEKIEKLIQDKISKASDLAYKLL